MSEQDEQAKNLAENKIKSTTVKLQKILAVCKLCPKRTPFIEIASIARDALEVLEDECED